VPSQTPVAIEPEPSRETHLLEYVEVFRNRLALILAIFLGVTGVATVRSLLTRPVYRAATQILIEPENPNPINVGDLADPGKGRDDYYQTQYNLLHSRSLARRAVENLNLLQNPEFGGPRDPKAVEEAKAAAPGSSPLMEGVINGFLARLIVSPIAKSRLVALAFEAYSPQLAAEGANALAKLYILQTLEFRFRTSSEAGQWLGAQIEEQRKKVQDAEQELDKIKQRDGIVNIEERRGLLAQKLVQLGSSLTQLKTQRLEKEALYAQMKGAANPEDLPEVQRSQVVQGLRSDLAGLERQKAQLLEQYLERHPDVLKVQAQIDETRRRISAESQVLVRGAGNDYKAALAQEASLSQALEATKTEIEELSQRSVQYDTFKRELDASKQMLNNLLDRSKQTDIQQQMKSSNIRIVDPAVVPGGPIRPNRPRDVSTGALLGLFLAIGIAFLLEYLDNTVKTPEDVRVHLPGVPLLGVVPESNDANLIVSITNQSVFSEGYRVVRTALTYSWPEQGSRTILVTSTAPGEGKTLTSVNLALTLASLGGQVLLVDCDLRKPQTHSLLRVKRVPGLSDVLVGKAKPSDAIQALQYLSFLPAGTHAPSPADLVTTHTMKVFLDALRGRFDWIIVDTPPVGAVSEALVLGSLTDGVIIVAGAEMVPRKAVAHTVERVNGTGARTLGVILNRAQVQKHSYYYGRYYGHYYGHYYGRYAADRLARERHAASAGARKVASIRDKRGT
jgi:capsular exopolysaccharide synthesis family protein